MAEHLDDWVTAVAEQGDKATLSFSFSVSCSLSFSVSFSLSFSLVLSLSCSFSLFEMSVPSCHCGMAVLSDKAVARLALLACTFFSPTVFTFPPQKIFFFQTPSFFNNVSNSCSNKTLVHLGGIP